MMRSKRNMERSCDEEIKSIDGYQYPTEELCINNQYIYSL